MKSLSYGTRTLALSAGLDRELRQRQRRARRFSVSCPYLRFGKVQVRQRNIVGLTCTFLVLLFLPLCACTSEPEPSKALVKISNVKVWRTDEHTLKVALNYDLEMGVHLPLPYKEVLVFPLEPKVKLAGALAPFDLHVGSVGVTLPIPGMQRSTGTV
jgi:hypothetical protein